MKRKRQRFQRMAGSILAVAMAVSPLSAAAYRPVEASGGAAEFSYQFVAESIVVNELPAEEAKMQVTIERSGDIAKPSEMVLLSCDMNADYGEDYTLSCNGKELPKEEGANCMYAAFRDSRVISDYQEDNRAFAEAVLAYSGFSLAGENELVPLDGEGQAGKLESLESGEGAAGSLASAENEASAAGELAGAENGKSAAGSLASAENEASAAGELAGAEDEEGAAGSLASAENEKSAAKGLTDADKEGINYYEALSTMYQAGAVSSRSVLPFAAGERVKEITLTVKPDKVKEYDEGFLLGVVSPQTEKYLKDCGTGIPDIPLREGRDITLTSVTIGDASGEKPLCSVSVEKAGYTLGDGEEKASVTFRRTGATDTYSTVVLMKEGQAYGYFYFAPYQEVQQAELEAGSYGIQARQNCTVSGEETVTVEGRPAERKTGEKGEAASHGGNSLDTVYEYDALPDGSHAERTRKTDKGEADKKGGTRANGNPDWFADWMDNNGVTETADYIAYAQQGKSLFQKGQLMNTHYAKLEYINDKNRTHGDKSVYNTWRMDTSGFLSGAYDNECVAYTVDNYEVIGIESVEARYYVNDTDLNMTLSCSSGVSQRDYVSKSGVHDIKVSYSENDRPWNATVTIANDNHSHHDGADVYVMNGLKFNKRTYQIAVDNSNKLDYVTRSGDTEQVAAEAVSSDKYSYMKMGDTANNDIVMNMKMYDNYPMALTGYCLVDKHGKVIDSSYVQSDSSRIRFNKEFIEKNQRYSYVAKREGEDKAYTTLCIQPVVSKIPLQEFQIQNGSRDSVYNPYLGELVLENKSKDLYQGDYVTLSARDVQEGYTFSGVYIRRRKTESADWQSVMQYADSSGRVVFHLDSDYSYYQLEPVFSGHEANTVTVSYADGARDHGSLTAEGKDNGAMIVPVSPEEYQINSYVPLVANPKEGYVTCWYSGNRTYYGNTFYYQMDGNSKHNDIVVDFLPKSDVKVVSVDMELRAYENEVNLRNSSFAAGTVPLAGMQFVTTSGKSYQGTTGSNGEAVIEGFEGVVGGTYSMMLYQPGENRYRYVEYVFSGQKSCDVKAPAFAGMSAYPDKVTARINGTGADQGYIDLTDTGEVEITVEVFRPDKDTSLGEVGLSFRYQGDDGMAKQDYTVAHPDQASEDDASLGVYDTYTLKVSPLDIPNLSSLYVNVKSSYEVIQTQEGGAAGQAMTVTCDTGYVDTGYSFKTPNESSELAVLEDVPDLPGLEDTGEDVSIPFIGSLDFGFSAKNGAYFSRQDDPNTDTFYLLAGYNVANTWAKTTTDKYQGAKKTREALNAAEQKSREAGDLNGGGSKLVRIPGSTVINIAPAVSLKFAMKDIPGGGYQVVGYDAVIGLDELISFNAPFSIYGIPCYVNVAFNGEQFLEVHASSQEFGGGSVTSSILQPTGDTDMDVYIQAPNLDINVKTGVGYNAFAGIYLSMGGNLKFNIQHTDQWKSGGYFYVRGGIGADLAVFSIEETVNIPGSNNQAFGDAEARKNIHAATTTLSGKGVPAGLEKGLEETIDAVDKNPVFTVSRNRSQFSQGAADRENGDLNAVLKPAGKNVKMKLLKLSGKKVMAVTLEDNGAPEGSLNYLGAVYAISNDGGKTWESRDSISKSDKLQWNPEFYKLKDKLLLTWSEGDLDSAAAGGLNAKSEFKAAAVARALTAFNLRGRYFSLDGKPLGESFTIAEDGNVAINSLDAVENENGTVDIYYERRAYNQNASTLTELMSQEQTICRAVFNSEGKAAAEDKRFLVQSQDGRENYRVTELEGFSHKGIEGQVVVLDRDGKLMKETEGGTEPSIDDRQVYLRILSDKNGNIPANTLIPVTEPGVCAQNIVLLENNGHLYLFWNQDGSIVSMSDFLPETSAEYDSWKEHTGSFGTRILVSGGDSLPADKEFRVAMDAKGKGVLLWKGSEGRQYSDDALADQIYAGIFTADENGDITSSRGPILLRGLLSEIDSLDVQVLDNGQIVYGYTELDGTTKYESKSADAIVQEAVEAGSVKINSADSEEYPLPGQEYRSYLTLWNNGMADVKNLTISASGAFHAAVPLAELMGSGTGNGILAAGQVLKVSLPVQAADTLQDGDEVVYTISQNGKTLATLKDTVHRGAYIVPEEMASVISIPGTDDYRISLPVVNKGNQEGTAQVDIYTYDRGSGRENTEHAEQWEYRDGTALNPGDRKEISYIVKGAAREAGSNSMIGFQTGDGYGQAVDGALPDRAEAVDNGGSPYNPVKPGAVTKPGTVKKGDILTLGSGSSRAAYQVASSGKVSYHRPKLPKGVTAAKIPATVKISGKTYQVTGIAAKAFQGNKKIKKVVIGKNVKKIPARAFAGCKKLEALTVKSEKLTKKGVKNSLKGSSVKSIKTIPSLQKRYQKYFTKKNAGRKVRIRK